MFPLQELTKEYAKARRDKKFRQEVEYYLREYVGRPTPLYFAERMTKELGGAKIYFKREDLCHTGAHKVNNTIGQILVAKRLGKKKIIAETGAGQHGVATATVCALKGVECIVYMGEKDIERQAPNVARMKMLGATVIPATSGSKTLKDATNEAIRDWINNPNDTHYIIGSVVGPHPYPDMVARFQSVISEEIRWQLKEKIGGELPTHVIACVGGGSNAAGAFYHFLDEPSVQLIAVEAAGLGVDSGHSAATTALGRPGILHGSKSFVMQTEDGQVVEPHSISAGLDYPGIGPLHAHLFDSGRAKFLNATDGEALAAAFELAKLEGIIPALESAHALSSLTPLSLSKGEGGPAKGIKLGLDANKSTNQVDEQMKFKKDSIVVVCLSGRGDKDMATYMKAI
jgi:tryptophan synthase beta chain